MPYQYRCDHCRTTSRVVYRRAEAHMEGRAHREKFHAGHRPDGEHLDWVPRWETFDYGALLRMGGWVLTLLVADWLWRHH